MERELKSKYERLLEILGEVDDLQRSCSILSWDKHTYMPSNGAKYRSIQMSSLTKMAHERFTSKETGKLIEALETWASEADSELPEVRIVKVAARNYKKASQLPLSFVKEKADICNDAYFGWLKAREDNCFATYVPFLERLVEIHFKEANILGYKNHVLDPLIDNMEGGLGALEVESIFNQLRTELPRIAKIIREDGKKLRLDFMDRDFPGDKQLEASYAGMKKIGFDFSKGRVDQVVHPFCSAFSPGDVRVTTKIVEGNPTSCFFSCLHEGGHGLYDLSIPAEYFRTPVYGGASSGLHESQSRLWENIIGRSKTYWKNFYPEFKQYFHEQLSDVSMEEWYEAINQVRPTYIRAAADEVTYNLHIMLRFELEKAVMDGKIKVSDLEDRYNATLKEFLGLSAPEPKNGVIQDIHWTEFFGTSYQGYTIGNIAGVQFFEAAKRSNPEIKKQIEIGNYSGLLKWLNENMHVHGAYYQPQDLMRVATGKSLDATEYLNYIKTKYGEIYGVNLEEII